MASEKKFIRFCPAIDIIFLREVAAVNPYSDPAKWEKVAAETNRAVTRLRPDAKPFTERSVKDRLSVLLTAYIKEDMANLKKSGTEEEYAERDQLLQDIRDVKEESEEAKKEKKGKADQKIKELEKKGEEVRRKAMEGLSKEPTPKKSKFDVGDYLQKKSELEERRIAIEERRLEAANEERRGFMEALLKLANK